MTDKESRAREAPSRVLRHTYEFLAAEIAREAISEWMHYAALPAPTSQDHEDVAHRIAILAELGVAQATIDISRRSGLQPTHYNRKDMREHIAYLVKNGTPAPTVHNDPVPEFPYALVKRLQHTIIEVYSKHTARNGRQA